jgi:hypothetical protein
VFATFSDEVEPLAAYVGPVMGGYIDRIFHKPVGGCQIICVSVAEGPILEKGIRDDDIQA